MSDSLQCGSCSAFSNRDDNFCHNCGTTLQRLKFRQSAPAVSSGLSPEHSKPGRFTPWLVSLLTLLVFTPISVVLATNYQSILPSFDRTIDSRAVESVVKEDAYGFTTLGDDWTFKFVSEVECSQDATSCVGLLVTNSDTCNRAMVGLILHSSEQTFLKVSQQVEFSTSSEPRMGSTVINVTSPKWVRVGIDGVQCLAPAVEPGSKFTGLVTAPLEDRFQAPNGFTQVGESFAYRWQETVSCDPLYLACWTMDIAHARPCSAVTGNFTLLSKSGEKLSTVASTRNVDSNTIEIGALQFGTGAPLDVEKVLIEVTSFDCHEASVSEALEEAASRATLPDSICVNSNCTDASEGFTLPKFSSSTLEEVSPWSTGNSNFSGGGYTVLCNDGSISHAGGKQGACSWHGGVSR